MKSSINFPIHRNSTGQPIREEITRINKSQALRDLLAHYYPNGDPVDRKLIRKELKRQGIRMSDCTFYSIIKEFENKRKGKKETEEALSKPSSDITLEQAIAFLQKIKEIFN